MAAGFLSAQNADVKNNENNKDKTNTTNTTTTNTTTTVTKSTPVLKKKLVLVSSDKLNTRSSAIQADDKTNNVGKKEEEKTPE